MSVTQLVPPPEFTSWIKVEVLIPREGNKKLLNYLSDEGIPYTYWDVQQEI